MKQAIHISEHITLGAEYKLDPCHDGLLIGAYSNYAHMMLEAKRKWTALLHQHRVLLRPVLLAGWDGEQRGFRGQRDLDCSAPRVRWLCTPLRRKAEAQGSRPSKPEKKGTRPIGNSRGIAARVGRLLSGSGKVLDTFLCPLHESGLVEGGRM